jgi:protoheme IX farnesyltransferase
VKERVAIFRKSSDMAQLVKLRLTLTVVLSSVLAYLIALPSGVFQWTSLVLLALGGFFTTAAANVLNEVLEREYDAKMTRTMNRPLADERMRVGEAVLYAGLFTLIGIVFLALFNPLTSFLGTLALVIYAFIYTPMKRISPISVVVGAIPGALPVLIGSVAAEGRLTLLGLILFTFQFLWQFPHFWSIGWLGFEDYSKAGYKLLPVDNEGNQDRSIGVQSLVYVIFLFPVGILPFVFGYSGVVSLVVVTLMTAVYAFFAFRFKQQFNKKTALGLMFCSFLYIPVSLVVFLMDKI